MMRSDRFLLAVIAIALVTGVVAVIAGPDLISSMPAENITPVDIGGPGWALLLRDIDNPITTEEMNDRIRLAVREYRDRGGWIASEMYYGNSTGSDDVGTLAFGFVIDEDGVPGTYTGSGNRGAVGTIHEKARKWFSRYVLPRCPCMMPPCRIEDCDGLPLMDLSAIPVIESGITTGLRTNTTYVMRVAMQDEAARELLWRGGTIEGVVMSIHRSKMSRDPVDAPCGTYPALRITGRGITLDVMVNETAGTVVGSNVEVPTGAGVQTRDNHTEICLEDEVLLAFATTDAT
jgi:hypothetical protein